MNQTPQNHHSDPLVKTLQLCSCKKCGATWWPRVERPVRCPRCESIRWRTPRRDSPKANPVTMP